VEGTNKVVGYVCMLWLRIMDIKKVKRSGAHDEPQIGQALDQTCFVGPV
jgi:hypothetical protein